MEQAPRAVEKQKSPESMYDTAQILTPDALKKWANAMGIDESKMAGVQLTPEVAKLLFSKIGNKEIDSIKDVKIPNSVKSVAETREIVKVSQYTFPEGFGREIPFIAEIEQAALENNVLARKICSYIDLFDASFKKDSRNFLNFALPYTREMYIDIIRYMDEQGKNPVEQRDVLMELARKFNAVAVATFKGDIQVSVPAIGEPFEPKRMEGVGGTVGGDSNKFKFVKKIRSLVIRNGAGVVGSKADVDIG
jgi:hypothetical protein